MNVRMQDMLGKVAHDGHDTTLMNLPLHAAHHLRSSTPYERLRPYDESPQLPGGYYQMFWIALIPPLFNRLMQNPLIAVMN